MSRILMTTAASIVLGLSSAQAAVCDYRLSEVIAARAPALAAATADQALVGKMGAGAQDFFTLTDGNGLTALGAVFGRGTGAVGAVKGVADTMGLGGTIVTSQAIGMAAGVAAVGALGLEGVCRFQDERITDYYEVLAVLSAVAETADPRLFQLQLGAARQRTAVVEIWDAKTGVRQQYRVADLFFVNGELKLNRIGFNKSLGFLMQFRGSAPALDTPPLDAFGP